MKAHTLLVTTGLVAAISLSSGVIAGATEIETAEQEAATTQDELDSIRTSIDDLETQKEELTGEIDDLQSRLVSTISGIASISKQIEELLVQMDQTQEELQLAEVDRDIQYEAMKKRIQYLYETGGEAGWASVFLSGGNLSDVLDKAEYTQQMYDYDRQQLEEYLVSIEKVEALQDQQREEKSALETRKREQEDAQKHLEDLIAEAEKEYDDFDDRLEEAYQMAEEYESLIAAQNEAIAQLIAAQEAMGVSTEEAAVVAQQIVESFVANGEASTAAVAATGGNEDYFSNTGQGGAGVGTTRYSGTSQISQSTNTSANGQAILAYAQQFLGNSYVYGGNSLTNGVDCSGFVQQVYKNFGISTSRTSWDIESDGQSVSYNDVQVGDVVCYGGHVGIYAGDGKIINAIDEAHGIGYSDVNYAEIRSVRRFVSEDEPAAETTAEEAPVGQTPEPAAEEPAESAESNSTAESAE